MLGGGGGIYEIANTKMLCRSVQGATLARIDALNLTPLG